MYQLGIVSGKGGVGKSTITASLSYLFHQMGLSIIAADVDVDAPNLAILFKSPLDEKQTDKDTEKNADKNLENNANKISEKNATSGIVDSFKVKTAEKASFKSELCIHCKKCIDESFCLFHALSWDETQKIPIVDTIACEGCQACHWLCPQKAFDIYAVESGTVSKFEGPYGFPVITGETILGAQTSGKLVTELKQYAKDLGKETNRDLIIYDGPPGIGCPVIATVGELNYIIVVIEPTPASYHDAHRVMNVIENFKIPYGVIINKADLWDEAKRDIIEDLNKKNIEILGEINLDDDWPFSIANGKPIVVYRPNGESAKRLHEIAEKIKIKIDQHKSA